MNFKNYVMFIGVLAYSIQTDAATSKSNNVLDLKESVKTNQEKLPTTEKPKLAKKKPRVQRSTATTSYQTPDIKHYRELNKMADYKAVMNSPKPQIIKFYTNSCGACKSMEPIFNEVAGHQNPNFDFSAINIETDAFKDLVSKHSLKAVPTTIFVKSGETLKRVEGSMTKDDFETQIRSIAKN